MFIFRRATVDDITILVKNRMKLLQSANCLENVNPLEIVKKNLYQYYNQSLTSGDHIAYLATLDNLCIGSGDICFYQVLPTYHNPSGRKAYITNMYTDPHFRKRGIATKILDLLVAESIKNGIRYISLEATESGRSVYERYGFVTLHSEMQLKNETFDERQNTLHQLINPGELNNLHSTS